MKNNISKEQWIDDVLGSTQGMRRAAPPVGLYENITPSLNNRQAVNITSLVVRKWAAAAILLLAVNMASVIYYTAGNRKAKAGTNDSSLAMELQSVSTYNY